MDKEDQLSFDFKDKLPFPMQKEEKTKKDRTDINDLEFPLPSVNEETEVAPESTDNEIDDDDLEPTQRLEPDASLTGAKEDFAPPQNVDYTSAKIPTPFQTSPKTAKDIIKPQPLVDPEDFGDTQTVEIDPAQMPDKQEFAPPENVNYKSVEIPVPTQTAEEPSPKYKAAKETEANKLLKPHNMKRAILGWLLPQKPSGVGVHVPSRVSKYCADVAAFWSAPAKKRLMQPNKTVIIEIRRTREQCWPDCSRQEELLPLLIEQKELRSSLETEIQRNEPELKDTDNLFPEYETWRYSESKNRKYRKCRNQIERIEHALYKGSRFEQIRRAHVADFLYLAVPEGTVDPKELADGWGLINVKSDLSASVIKEAETWNCPIPNRLHLAQNIAASSRDALFFSFGIRSEKSGKALFSPIPKRRRNK